MNLIKTSFLSFVATGVKLLSALVINKFVSIFIGPSGLATIGQLQNCLGIIQVLSQGGINSGVVKYTAENNDLSVRRLLWSNALKITLICSSIISLFLFVFSSYISEYVFNTCEFSYVFFVLAFTIVLFSINQLLLSILNGLKEIKTFISINIIQSCYSLVFSTLFIVFLGLDGALIAMVTNQSVILFVILWKLRNHKFIIFENFRDKFNENQSKKLFSYSLMALVTAFTAPVSLMVVRNYIAESISWNAAGYWQAINYISSMYLMVITTALSTYFLPRLSEIENKMELRSELKKGYFILIPLVILLSGTIYLLKDFIIWFLFNDEFKPMRMLFKWQLIGDVFKISSWLVAYLMLAKAMSKMFIITEVVFSFSFVILSIVLIDKFGIVGATYAYALNYILYMFFIMLLMRKQVFN
ncbi:O-antigen translocase [Vibrio scophthalmi]|uniref:Polysaccharide biosynthesis protein n=1 Tax=Vibrio scophthalmi LMG 19158 TaxID=870967 RepID=F9RR26_9VIBR|nr:O-antigen translocase [Vibrio scophthalmi]EGU33612.1 polysaccharide biosynthesis protein [Vibrio scophthalmi LMG 19158]